MKLILYNNQFINRIQNSKKEGEINKGYLIKYDFMIEIFKVNIYTINFYSLISIFFIFIAVIIFYSCYEYPLRKIFKTLKIRRSYINLDDEEFYEEEIESIGLK